MRLLGRLVVFAALVEVGCWVLATALRPGSGWYNISDLYAAGAPRPLLVMAGEVVFALGLAVLVLGLHRSLPATDHRVVGCGLLIVASLGTMAGVLARDSCEESVPRCEGDIFTTAADWVHGVGGLTEILGIAGAAIVLAAVLPRPWSTYSATTGARSSCSCSGGPRCLVRGSGPQSGLSSSCWSAGRPPWGRGLPRRGRSSVPRARQLWSRVLVHFNTATAQGDDYASPEMSGGGGNTATACKSGRPRPAVRGALSIRTF